MVCLQAVILIRTEVNSPGGVCPFGVYQNGGLFLCRLLYLDNFMNNWPDGQPGKPCDDMSRPGNSLAQIVCLFHNQ